VFPSSAVREAVTDNMAGAQIRYDGHNRKRKHKQKKKEQLTKVFYVIKGSKTYRTDTSTRAKIKWTMQPRLARLA
jgi:hypothetical protein